MYKTCNMKHVWYTSRTIRPLLIIFNPGTDATVKKSFIWKFPPLEGRLAVNKQEGLCANTIRAGYHYNHN